MQESEVNITDFVLKESRKVVGEWLQSKSYYTYEADFKFVHRTEK